jgi:hypothetical protein
MSPFNFNQSTLTTRGFVTVANGAGNGDVNAKVGGRVDFRHRVNDINFTISGTDASARGYEDIPWVRDAVITADTRVNDFNLGVGFDAGTQGAILSASTGDNTLLSNRDVSAKVWWFQKGNTVRAEGSINLDANNKIWGAYTHGTTANTENRSFVNIKERDGFIIEPFTASIATAALAYTLTKDDYTFEAAYDVNRSAAFLTAGKRVNLKTAFKAGYSFKDEVALVEVAHKHNADLPALRAFVKAPAGANGVGRPSAGVILDKVIEL